MALTQIKQSNIDSGFSPSYRNLIINGDMQIAQRGTSQAGITGVGYYTVDRWRVSNGGAGTWTMTQDADVPNGQGFSKSLKMQCTTAEPTLGVDDNILINQRVEGYTLQQLAKGTSNAKSVSFSFWIKSNKTGTYICEIYDLDNGRNISKAYTIDVANTWERKTITFAGDTSGAFDNDNNASMQISWQLAPGANYTSGTLATSWESAVQGNRYAGQTVNLADSTSNYINITGVQLEVGEAATPFEHRPYGTELDLCQRYCYTIATSGAYSAYATTGQFVSTTRVDFPILFPTYMRGSPTGTYSAANTFLPSSAGADFTPSAVASVAGSASSQAITVTFTVSGATAGRAATLTDLNTASSKMTFSAEL